MSIIIVYLIYLWITVIHCIFTGATLYFFWGARMVRHHRLVNIAIFAVCLAFLETYWMPLSGPMQLTVSTTDTLIQRHFGIDRQTNIIGILRPRYFHVVLWLVQGVFTEWLCRRQYIRIVNRKGGNQ